MKCVVLKPFKAWPRSGPNIPRDFDVGDALENIEVGTGDMVAFEVQGSQQPIIYYLRKDFFDDFTSCA